MANAITSRSFGSFTSALCALVSLTMGFMVVASPSLAAGQMPAVIATQANVRARLAQAGTVKLAGQVSELRSKVEQVRKRVAAGDTKARVELRLLEARLAELERKGERGCATFKDAAVQMACLRMLRATTAGTDQETLETTQLLMQGVFASKRTTKTGTVPAVGGGAPTQMITKVVKYAPLPKEQGAGGRCVRVTRITGATAEAPGSILRLECHDPVAKAAAAVKPPDVVPFAAPSVSLPSSDSGGLKYLLAALGGATGGALIGAGAGWFAQPSVSDENGYSSGGAGWGAMIGGGTGLVVGLTVAALLGGDNDDNVAAPNPPAAPPPHP